MKESQNTIIERKQKGIYETRGEWFDRMGRNVGKMVCIGAIVMTVVGAVVHVASQMWWNVALDFIVMVVFSVLLGEREG